MAGSYPDIPARRFAYDVDGTRGFLLASSGTSTEFTAAQLTTLNDESAGSITIGGDNSGYNQIFLFFPELRDIAGYFVNQAGQWGTPWVEFWCSPDTTTGFDGTWTKLEQFSNPQVGITPVYRNFIRALSGAATLGVRGIRLGSQSNRLNDFVPSAFHVYGTISAGQSLQRLDLWHPTLDQALTGTYFDWGNIQQAGTMSRQFRIKNASSTQTANGVVFDTAPTNAEPSPTLPTSTSQLGASFSGGAYASSVTVGNLAPGAISGIVTLRRVTLTNAQIGLTAMRVRAYAASWS
jgi:hypothetical protein